MLDFLVKTDDFSGYCVNFVIIFRILCGVELHVVDLPALLNLQLDGEKGYLIRRKSGVLDRDLPGSLLPDETGALAVGAEYLAGNRVDLVLVGGAAQGEIHRVELLPVLPVQAGGGEVGWGVGGEAGVGESGRLGRLDAALVPLLLCPGGTGRKE